jgi:predicted DNA-binding transcriptional regulator AlpA
MSNKNYDPLAEVRVVGEPEAIKLVDLSPDTWGRMKKLGETPPAVQLSERRIGYRVCDIIEWLEKRRVVAPTAAVA